MNRLIKPATRRLATIVGLIGAAAVLAAPGALATHGPDAEVTVGSDDAVMLQNKQNEPTVAINPIDTDVIAAGANDNIDLEGCNNGSDNTCPFTDGVGVTGTQFSLDGATSWMQPSYTGFSARACVGLLSSADSCSPTPGGLIGTLPHYFENNLVSDGDPVVAFGPKPGPAGFSWSNGARLYFSNLTSNIVGGGPGGHEEQTFKGFEAIAVSRTDDVATAAGGGPAGKAAWMPPVVVSAKQSEATFADKEELWADNAESSPFFGNVYVCWAEFRSVGGPPEPLKVGVSRDGGDTWKVRQISESENAIAGRQGCVVRTDSDGVVYVFWRGGEQQLMQRVIFMSRSFDGGTKFERPAQVVATRQECGLFDVAQGRRTFDGRAGARTNSTPNVSIANGAPGGNGPDTIVLTWCDGPTTTTGFGEEALIQVSTDKGETWSAPVDAAPAGHRPDFPAVAVSPDGTDVYTTYMNFLQPWQATTANPRLMHGVVRHANLNPATGMLGPFTTIHTGDTGDARGSSTNSLVAEFLGDYNYVSATNNFAVAVWNDVRNAASCPAINDWRQARVNFLLGTGPNPGDPPGPQQACPVVAGDVFGNSDIFGTRVDDPTP